MEKRKKKIAVVLVLMLCLMSISFASASVNETVIKNVIILIPDGTRVEATTLARWYQGGGPLALDEMACGLSRTYWSDGPITDSAPGGTAIATGYKTYDKYVGVLPEASGKKPVASVLEGAQTLGKATGIVATSEIMHATPADFTAHYPDRSKYDEISEQQVYNGLDVVLGGGYQFFTSEVRGDKENLIQEIKNLGYDLVTTPEAMKASKSSKLWGLFAQKDLSYDFDRDPVKQPSLAEMTKKAIEVLSKDKDGFFMMVEGSKVDWAAHSNDPIGVISDVLAFDAAVKEALDFAKQDGHTVVISVTDHGTGGMTIGSAGTNKNYSSVALSAFMDPLKKAKLTGEGLEAKLSEDKSNVVEVMAEYFGITDLTEEEIVAIKAAEKGKLNSVVGPMISKRANIGWTTGGHTGEDVVFYAYAPNGDRPTGVIENTDIAQYMARIMGFNLEEVTNKRFVHAETAFEAKGATVEWDDTDSQNPVLVVKKGSDVLKLPVNKNIAALNRKVIRMKGITVFNGITTYVPQEAIDLIK
ncbi:MAG: alkaline phosphatase [Bacillota bacterium]